MCVQVRAFSFLRVIREPMEDGALIVMKIGAGAQVNCTCGGRVIDDRNVAKKMRARYGNRRWPQVHERSKR